jgi:hypothetical protein
MNRLGRKAWLFSKQVENHIGAIYPYNASLA